MNKIVQEIEIGNRKLSLETGFLAQQANGSVLGRYGDTVVLATVCSAPAKESLGYFPLSVEYEERLYAGGKIKTSRFIKREGRPSDNAILNARLIDRSIRPLFPKDYLKEVQVIVTILSVDQENDPDVVAAVATSAALSISDIPWAGPVSTVRVGLKDNQLVINPVNGELAKSSLNLVVSATKEAVVMIEAAAHEVSEEQMAEAIEYAKKENDKIVAVIEELAGAVGRTKEVYEVKQLDEELKKEVLDYIQGNFTPDFFEIEKSDRKKEIETFKANLYAAFEGKLAKEEMDKLYEEVLKQKMRALILKEEKRVGGRKLDEIRQLYVEVGILPRTHGSALFQRGDTQILTIVTLGSTSLGQLIESMEGEETKRYMHHYNFPPYSVGEAKRMGFPSRREIGHGALAEKAVFPVIPGEEQFPYAVRVVSETLSSAGSTSMGSVCGSTLALMDAGVPLKSPVAGIAMGIIVENKDYKILSDIQDLEDFYGDMDFKVAGTDKGITALQLDVKTLSLTAKVLKEVLDQAKKGREFILQAMLKVLGQPRPELSVYAPRAEILKIDPKKIGEVIGPGGKIINRIIEATKTTIDIDDDGKVSITAEDSQNLEKAVAWIKGITEEIAPGMIFEGTVTRIMPFGAIVEFFPGKDGMVHISEIAPYRIQKVEDELSLGQKVKVKVLKVDDSGKIGLTLRLDRVENDETQRPNPRFEKRGNFVQKERSNKYR